jgi:hypothetical protein
MSRNIGKTGRECWSGEAIPENDLTIQIVKLSLVEIPVVIGYKELYIYTTWLLGIVTLTPRQTYQLVITSLMRWENGGIFLMAQLLSDNAHVQLSGETIDWMKKCAGFQMGYPKIIQNWLLSIGKPMVWGIHIL